MRALHGGFTVAQYVISFSDIFLADKLPRYSMQGSGPWAVVRTVVGALPRYVSQ